MNPVDDEKPSRARTRPERKAGTGRAAAAKSPVSETERKAKRRARERPKKAQRTSDGKALNAIRRALRLGDPPAIQSALLTLSQSPKSLELHFPDLASAAEQAGHKSLLFAAAVALGAEAFPRLRLLAHVAGLAQTEAERDEARKLLSRARRFAKDAPIRFDQNDTIAGIAAKTGLNTECRRLLSGLKYDGLSARSAEQLFRAATILSTRIDLDPTLMELLYAHRQDAAVDETTWLSRVAAATALSHLMRDQPKAVGRAGANPFEEIVDRSACEAVFKSIASEDGLVVCNFHGGFMHLGLDLFSKGVPNAAVLRTAKSAGSISVKQDSRAALILAVRAAMQGSALIMSPDGRRGSLTRKLDLLGQPISVAEGAALIAYEAKCGTAWYTVEPQGARLVPVLKTGPRPEKRESFEDFSARWLQFYWGEVADTFTGPPERIALLQRWNTLAHWDRSGRKSEE